MRPEYYEKLAQVESGGKNTARNPKSSAKGKFQFVDATAKQYGITAPFGTPEYEQQEREAVQRFTADNARALESILGRPPNDGELYLAHQQGAEGASKILGNPSARAVDLVGRDALVNNLPSELKPRADELTAQEFAQVWTRKFPQTQSDAQNVGQGAAQMAQEMINVVLPDGTRVKNVPANITKQELIDRLSRNGYDVSGLTGAPAPVANAQATPEVAQQAQPAAPTLQQRAAQMAQEKANEPPGFIDRVIADVGERGREAETIQAQTAAGMQNKPTEIARMALQPGVGILNDIVGNAVQSGITYTPEAIRRPVGSALEKVGQMQVPFTKDMTVASGLGGGLSAINNAFQDFEKKDPVAAGLVESGYNALTSVVPVGALFKTAKATVKGLGVVDDVLKQTGAAIKNVESPSALMAMAKTVPAKQAAALDDYAKAVSGTTLENLNKARTAAYAKTAAANGNLDSSVIDNYLDDLLNDFKFPEQAVSNVAGESLPEYKMFEYLENMNNNRGRELSIQEIEGLDQWFNQEIFKNTEPLKGLNPVGRYLTDMKQKLREDVYDAVQAGKVTGGEEGWKAIKEATDLYAKEMKVKDLETIKDIIPLYPHMKPEMVVEREVRKIVNPLNKKKGMGYTKAEKKALTKAIQTNPLQSAVNAVSGKFASRVALGTGNIPGAAVMEGASMVGNVVDDALQLRKLNELQEFIATGIPRKKPSTALETFSKNVGTYYAGEQQ